MNECSRCQKPEDLCVCAELSPTPTRLHVLILQHPQEPDKALGSARIAHLSLPNSSLKIGLSWRNLGAALGREADPKRWAVLYLGSGLRAPDGSGPAAATVSRPGPGVKFVDKKAAPLPQSTEEIARELEGIVVLDGTWSQAKALWWRNAWLLKLRRAILIPPRKSLYGELRREPRRECLSTIETVAYTLEGLGEGPAVSRALTGAFAKLLDRQRARLKARREKRVSASSSSD